MILTPVAPTPITAPPASVLSDTVGVYNILDYGGVADDATDNSQALLDAFAAANTAGGGDVYLPAGIYRYISGSLGDLAADNVTVRGAGPASILRALDPAHSAITLSGTRCGLKDLVIDCPSAAVRINTSAAAGVVVTGSQFELENVTVDGVAGGGYVFYGALNGHVRGCNVRDSLADGFNIYGASKYIELEGCYATGCGDDSFAVVSYIVDGAQCQWITFTDCYSLSNTNGDGFRVSGGKHIRINGGGVYQAYNRGLLLAPDGTYLTYGNYDVQVVGTQIDSPSMGGSYAAVRIAGYAGNIPDRTTLIGVTVLNSQSSANAAFEISNFAQNTKILDCTVDTALDYGASVGIGSSASKPQDTTIRGCTFASITADGIFADYAQGSLEILDNTFRDINTANNAAFSVIRLDASHVAASRIRVRGNNHLGSKTANLTKFVNAGTLTVSEQDNFSETGCTITKYGTASTSGNVLSYAEPAGSSNINVTATVATSPTDIVSAAALTFDGLTAVIVEFGTPDLVAGTAAGRYCNCELWDDTTRLGIIATAVSQSATAANNTSVFRRRLTPTAGLHTYKIRAYSPTGDGVVAHGAGGAGQYMPSYIKVFVEA